MIYKLYCDGATSNNGYEGAHGGWSWVLLNDKMDIIKQDSGGVRPATNNMCELLAMISGCEAAARIKEQKDTVIIFSDSAYIINCYLQKWYSAWEKNGWINSKKQPVANKALWEKLIPFFKDASFNFEKVKGHSKNNDEHAFWNNYVDNLAVDEKLKI